MFYLEWQNQLDILSDEEKIRFIYNLIRYHEGKEVELTSKVDKLVWNGVLPALRTNQKKYEERIEKNRKNGKLGGRPTQDNSKNQMDSKITNGSSKNQMVSEKPNGSSKNPKKPNGFSENPKNPITGNRQEITDNSKKIIENSKKETGDREKEIDNGKLEKGNGEKLNENPVEEIGDVSNSSSGDFNNNSTEKNTRSEQHQEILNKAGILFKDISNWQQEIEDLGIKGFIRKYSQIVGTSEEFHDLVKDYYYKIYLELGD